MAEQPISSQDEFLTLPISIPPLPRSPSLRHITSTCVEMQSTELHFRSLFASLVGAGKFESVTFECDAKAAKSSIEPAQALRLASHQKKRKREEEEEAQRIRDEVAAEMPSTWSRPLHRSGGSAVVMLADERSVDIVLKAVKKLQKSKQYPVWGEGVGDKAPALGSSWLKGHNKLVYPGNAAMQAVVDAFFTVYNRKEAEAERLARELRNEPDEDGFVTVTRGGRVAPARMDEAEEAKRKMLERQEKRKGETQNFYRWQLREKKKAEQAAFLAEFEEDKNKLRAMREKRRKVQPDT
ncbi:hypothetical protein PG987_002291 [Apiospora arundinis]